MSRIRQIRESVDVKLDKLDAHADALEADADFDKRREEMSQKIAAFKRQLGERKHHTHGKLAPFEGEVCGGFEQIAKAFKDLFARAQTLLTQSTQRTPRPAWDFRKPVGADRECSGRAIQCLGRYWLPFAFLAILA